MSAVTIHKEGRRLLWSLLALLVVVHGVVLYLFTFTTIFVIGAVCSAVIFLLVLQFFRNPIFDVVCNEQQLLAPADGRVVIVEEVEEKEYLKGRRMQISIFMSPLNVHVNRSPVGGVVTYCKYHSGKYLVAWHPKSSSKNEHTTIAVKMNNGTEILFRQIAGAVARRIRYYVKVGQHIEQGQEVGFIKFGSRVDVLLPVGMRLKVAVGDHTKGGRTVLGEF